MLNNQAWDVVADKLTEGDFYRANHRVLFKVMAALANEMQPLDAVTLAGALQARGLVEQSGGIAYLAELAETTPAAGNVGAYANIVRERAVLRDLIHAAHQIAESAYAPGERDSSQLLDEAERAVFGISEGRIKGDGPQPIMPLLSEAKARIEALSKSNNPITGLATGFEDLDRKTAGLQKSDLVIVAGRPSMGKTALAVNIAEHAAMNSEEDGAVIVFSMEQPTEQLVMRLLSSLTRIDQSRLRVGQMHDDDWPKFDSAVELLRGKPLYIDDSPALTVTDIRARARRVAREAPGQLLKLIVVDYMQLMRSGERKFETRTLELSDISRGLKAIAKEMKCPLIALSQLNRSVENRDNKRPRMADLRESGAIEQDADVILFIYREEVYEPDTEHKGLAELIIGKQRNGPTGMVPLSFIAKLMKFGSHAQGDYPEAM